MHDIMSESETDSELVASGAKVKRCTTCKLPLKGHVGPWGKNCTMIETVPVTGGGDGTDETSGQATGGGDSTEKPSDKVTGGGGSTDKTSAKNTGAVDGTNEVSEPAWTAQLQALVQQIAGLDVAMKTLQNQVATSQTAAPQPLQPTASHLPVQPLQPMQNMGIQQYMAPPPSLLPAHPSQHTHHTGMQQSTAPLSSLLPAQPSQPMQNMSMQQSTAPLPSLLPVQPSQVSPPSQAQGMCDLHNINNVQLPQKFLDAARAGEYVNFGEVLYTVDTAPYVCEQDKENAKKQNKVVGSFYTWLKAWNYYEQAVMAYHPSAYWHMSEYRKFIQDCDKKYQWMCVYSYDIRFRSLVAVSANKFAFGHVNSELFVTTLDATAVKQSGQCFRCKAFDHKVADCTFLQARPSLEAHAQTTTKPQLQQVYKNKKNTERYYFGEREICNNYQTEKCRFQHCQRAHVCRQCKGPDPFSKCQTCKPGQD